MATAPVLCKGATSSNEVLPLSVTSSGELNIASSGGLSVSGSVSVSNFPATQAISAASLPLPSLAATSTLQTTGNASLATIAGDTTSLDGKFPSQGQALSAASIPVVIASDQSAFAVSSTQSASSSQTSIASLSTGTTDTGSAIDTAGYSKVGIIVESDQSDTTVQLRWSHDGSNWYRLEAARTVDTIAAVESGGSSQNTLYFNSSPVAKYVQVLVRAGAATTNAEVLVNLH